MVATIGSVDEFVAVKERISPIPLVERPILGVSFVHVYVDAPPTFCVVNSIIEVLSPLQTT